MMQNDNYYTHEGEPYISTFPREWLDTHSDYDSGPENCLNCKHYGSWNGVFIGYCSNCAKQYHGERGCGMIDYCIENPKQKIIIDSGANPETVISAFETYLKDIPLSTIGNVDFEDTYIYLVNCNHYCQFFGTYDEYKQHITNTILYYENTREYLEQVKSNVEEFLGSNVHGLDEVTAYPSYDYQEEEDGDYGYEGEEEEPTLENIHDIMEAKREISQIWADVSYNTEW